MQQVFLLLSVIVGLITQIIGIYSIFKGTYKPQRITRTIFLLITILFVLSLLSQKDTSGIFLALVQLATSGSIFILSFKYGVGGKSKSDLIVLAIGLFTIFIWQVTQDPILALYLAILADVIGFFPTLVKSYFQPFTENPKFYFNDIIAGFFNLLALQSIELNTLAFPFYIFAINLMCFILIHLGRRRFKNLQIKI